VLTNVNRVLKKGGHAALHLTQNSARPSCAACRERLGLYEQCRLFLQMMDDAVKVKQVGGLHVVAPSGTRRAALTTSSAARCPQGTGVIAILSLA